MSRRLVLVLERTASGMDGWILRDARTNAVVMWPVETHRALALPVVAEKLSEWSRTFGCLYELRVRRIDGTIGETRTYPRSSDPKRSKG